MITIGSQENKETENDLSNTTAIRVHNLSKVYKLYPDQKARMKEALHPMRRKYHKDYYALNRVSFDVNKGEVTKFPAAVAQHANKSIIDLQKISLRVGDGNADGCGLENSLKALLNFVKIRQLLLLRAAWAGFSQVRRVFSVFFRY